MTGHTGRAGRALIFSTKIIVAHQVQALMEQRHARVEITDSDMAVYTQINMSLVDTVVVDVETTAMRGLALIAWARKFVPHLEILVIARNRESENYDTARRLGVDDAFFLNASGQQIDADEGLARELRQIRAETRLAL